MKASTSYSKPGKTAPRLIEDLLDYDPRYRASNPQGDRSILADPAPRFRGQDIQRKGPLDCHHILMRKDRQTNAPDASQHIKGTETFKVATYCITCKQHFTIICDYQNSTRHCDLQDEHNPLHHFITTNVENQQQHEARNQSRSKLENVSERYQFQCSADLCNLQVEIRIGPPRLTPVIFSTLLDPVKVAARGQRIIEGDPERYVGLSPVRPLQALGYLWTYIRNAKASSDLVQTPKRIAVRNKKFLLAFGDDSGEMFDYLGFTLIEEISTKDDGTSETAYFRQPPIIDESNADFYEDILLEIENKMRDRPPAEHQSGDLIIRGSPVSARQDIERSLGFYDYPKKFRNIDLTIPEHPYYASLGAVGSLTDDLLGWAYERQCLCDPINRPYYLDCLRDLAQGRESGDLDVKVVLAVSAGEYGIKEIENAYQYFSLDPNMREGDEHIAGLYKSRIESAPRQKDDARSHLLILAKARDSVILGELANDKTMTYDEALSFLDVSSTTDADTIVAQATVLAFDGDKSRVALALRAIAAQRQEYAIQVKISELEDTGEPLPSIDEAYKRLQIQTRSVPDSTVFAYYSSLSSGAASGSKDSFTQALRAIAHDRQSNFLFRKLEDPSAEVALEELGLDQPIGLNNIGNTCYLNSLLQYFYTIKPVRDVALNLGEYRLPLSDTDIANRRAGGRQNTKKEIEKGQRFTEELSDLFKNLRTAPTRAIRPTVELADLSFFNEEIEATIRRASIASPSGPPKNLFHPEGTLTTPMGPLQDTIPEDVEMVDPPTEKSSDTASNASESTLVEVGSPFTLAASDTDGDDTKSRTVSEPETIKDNQDAVMIDNAASVGRMLSPPPDKPPPIPPRNKNGLSVSTSKSDKLIPDNERWQLGTQQDVDEVIRNTTWRMMCAIKPTTTDPKTGEQSDKIRDTFYGDAATYLIKSSKAERKVESWSSLLVYASQKKAIDIYEAIDLTLDKQDVEVDGALIPQFSAIAKLPPILQIQINRTVYDKVKKQSVKVKGAVNFPETLYLDRYMDSPDLNSPLMQRRRDGWEMKSELQDLETRLEALQNSAEIETAEALPVNRPNNGIPSHNVTESLSNTKDVLSFLQEAGIPDIDIDQDLPALIEERITEIGLEIEETQKRIDTLKRNLADQFTDMRQYEYKLQAVFIHRGSAGAGHYWIYIYDFKNDIWREYNDERVEIVSNRKRIFDAQFAEGATPYYLVYVRASDREELVDPVCRQPTTPEPVEADMQDPEGWTNVSTNEVDEGVSMENFDDDVQHVEHARPKPLRPKAADVSGWEKQYAVGPGSSLDAHGKTW